MQLSQIIKEAKIEEQKNFAVQLFPKVFIPALNEKSHISLQEIFIKSPQKILEEIKRHGALLLRDFDIKSPNQAVALLKQLGLRDSMTIQQLDKLQMVVGSKDKFFLNSNELSMFKCSTFEQIKHSNLHNQFSQMNFNSEFVSIYCFHPALKGGNIVLMNWNQVYKYAKENHSDFMKKLQEKGICQIKVFSQYENPQNQISNGWKNSFKVANKQQAQKVFQQQNYQFQWLNNKSNDCKLKKLYPPQSVQLTSKISNYLNQMLSIYKQCSIKKNKFSQSLSFGDGQKISTSVLSDIEKNCEKHITEVSLKNGDFIILHHPNIRYIHTPWEGPDQLRKVYVSFMKVQQQSLQIKPKILHQILNSGYIMPLIGFGTWKIPKQQCSQVVYNAIKMGYRQIDCASVYLNQIQVGKGIKKALQQKIVKREQLFITSKLWNTYHRPQHVRAACERTLKDLGLQYLDLYLMHFPISLKYISPEKRYPLQWIYDPNSETPYIIEDRVSVIQTWKAMEDLVSAKLVKNIGVSNFTVALLRQLICSCQIKPAVLQTQIHPELTQYKLVRYAREEGIQLTSYSTFGATSYIEIGMAKENQPIYKNQLIQFLGNKYYKSPHQIILRWAIQRGLAVIPKSVNIERMKQNLEISQFSLSSEDMDKISALHKNRRYNDPGDFCQNAYGTFYVLYE